MVSRHPKSIRRCLLTILYERYLEDPLHMLEPKDVMETVGLTREELLPNIFYLYDRGLVELMTGYNQSMFASARITADGIDLVEDHYEFNLRFPAAPGEAEQAMAEVPVLVEQLIGEVDLSPLDGEARRCLLRDVQYLREELARPVERWRAEVLRTMLGWIEGCLDEADDVLPSLPKLREVLGPKLS